MAWTPLLIVLVAASCTTHAPPARVTQPCRPITVQVLDEASRPVTGARVRTLATYRQFGPSGLPEASYLDTAESVAVATDARGNAAVCQVRPDKTGWIVVDHLDWPQARVPAHHRVVTVGRARAAVVDVSAVATCNPTAPVRVTAYAESATMEAVRGTPGRSQYVTLSGLGPWRYWVRTEACGETVVRSFDGRTPAAVLTMDRSEAVVEYPAFAGGAVTVTAFGDSAPVLTATLPADGVAMLALPGPPGRAYCLMLEKDDQCLVTYTRVGEVARPGTYLDRRAMLERDCPACPSRYTAPEL